MVRLHEQLKFFVNYKISTDLAWQGLRIYLSGHEVRALCFSGTVNNFMFLGIPTISFMWISNPGPWT